MTTQHARITLEEAKELYSMGVMNTTTLVLLYFRIRLAENWTAKLSNKELIQELGISEASFYRAVSQLRCLGLLFWKVKGVTEYSLNPDTLYSDKALKSSRSKGSLKSEGPTLKSEGPTLKSEGPTLKDENPTLKDENPTLKDEKATPLKPASGKECAPPSSSIQIYLKLFSPLLQERGVKEKNITEFFEWWEEEGINNCGFTINNPAAYLNSEDRLTGEKRLFLKYNEWQKLKNDIYAVLNDPEIVALYEKLYGGKNEQI